MKLMIVDDHAGVRKMIRQVAAAPEDIVCECASGEGAVQLAPEFRPDAVTMDMRMPGMCGLTATRAIRALLPSVRIILVSSYDEPELRRAADETGQVDFLMKENLFELRALLEKGAPTVVRAEAEPEQSVDGNLFMGGLPNTVRGVEERLSDCERFPEVMAHELRAPLRIINSFASILKDEFSSSLPADACNYLQSIDENSRILRERLEGLIRLAKSADKPLRIETVDMNALVSETWRRIYPDYQKNPAQLKVQQLPAVQADLTFLRMVLENLLGNAIKFSALRSEPLVEVGFEQFPERTLFFIRDNGAGFDMNRAKRLFQPLSRLHSSHEFPGTGLGLALCQRLIQQHGGRIWAEAVKDSGATFYFTLPIRTVPHS